MRRTVLRRSVFLALMLAAPAASAVAGHAPCGDACAPETRHRKAEWGPELCRAKRLARLDCRGLAFEAEAVRFHHNQQALSRYYGIFSAAPVMVTAPAPAPISPPLPNPGH